MRRLEFYYQIRRTNISQKIWHSLASIGITRISVALMCAKGEGEADTDTHSSEGQNGCHLCHLR